MRPPRLYDRALRDPVREAVALAEQYCGGAWTGYRDPNDPGRQLIELGARLIELLAERVNRVPEKNLLAFLDLLGVERAPGVPAEAPATFTLAARSEVGQLVPAGTQIATTQSATDAAQVFETRNSFFATPARLVHAISLAPGADRFGVLAPLTLPPKPEELADTTRTVPIMSTDGAGLDDVEHALYLASANLFARKDPVDVTLEFTIVNGELTVFQERFLLWQRFDADRKRWIDIADVTYEPGPPGSTYETGVPRIVSVTFRNFPGTTKTIAAGYSDAWIVGRLKGPPGPAERLPVVGQIRGRIATPQQLIIPADAAAVNDTTADLSKPIFPFGERPRYGDAFHLASEKAFAPDVGSTTIRFTLRPHTPDELKAIFGNNVGENEISTTIEWQYLAKGGEWKTIKTDVHDLTVTVNADHSVHPDQQGDFNGTLFGYIGGAAIVEFTFAPASDAAPGKVGGISGQWIRAVLRSQNPYGRDGFVTLVPPAHVATPEGQGALRTEATTVLQVVDPTFIPPVIERVEIEYRLANLPIGLDRIAAANNFEIGVLPWPLATGAAFTPFVPLSDDARDSLGESGGDAPALYLGFDRKLGNGFNSLLIALQEPSDTARLMPETGNPNVVWEYAVKGANWAPLDVQDDTASLTSSGMVGFKASDDSYPLVVFPQLTDDTPFYWYRARLQSGTYATPPKLKAVLINSVATVNQETITRDWVLASGTGEPNQRATILRRPVLAGEIWVRESELPTDAEQQDLLNELKERAIGQRERSLPSEADILSLRQPAAAGDEQEIWVRWLRVPNFQTSGPRSRHYTLEPVTGEVSFGGVDGGMIPPIGKDNIVVRGLRIGGGETANRVAVPLAIKELKTSLPFIDQVFNAQGAVGGSDPWTLEQTFELGPQSIKNRGRAVTTEDYSWITLAAFSQVARAKCLPIKAPDPQGRLVTTPGAVSVIVVPKGSGRTPQPTKGLLRRIETHLRSHALGAIASDVHALPPQYHPVAVAVEVQPSKPEEASLLQQRVAQALDAFFHPLTGGEQGEGWPFGRSVYISEVFAVIERTDGVDYVVEAKFLERPDSTELPLGENELVASGSHQIRIAGV